MNLIIDIQCCKDSKKGFIPKEVAAVSSEGNHIGHWIVLPPCLAQKLPFDIRAENKWLRQSLHGIDWKDGLITKKIFACYLETNYREF